MTKEEFFEKYNSLEIEKKESHEKLKSIYKESDMLIAENVKNLLGIKLGDIIYQKSTEDAFKIYNISIQDNEFRLSLEYCGMVEYERVINDEEFLRDYMTKSQWDELIKKRDEDKEYQEYLRLKDKFERK